MPRTNTVRMSHGWQSGYCWSQWLATLRFICDQQQPSHQPSRQIHVCRERGLVADMFVIGNKAQRSEPFR